ncbi:HK97 family phage prohead protease [Paludibacter sp. 221]|uniref:HK97 family phage prohead protease n=1 Tax=Paludibacter sp. 221 TaxID=2302939 RepID=UPI0013D7F3E5|nr:HK97 family phage prohead protease [Paludibacter sp. 221]NDV46249.1 HK97 family phage prohead protease [Paludibacter sp. 221]
MSKEIENRRFEIKSVDFNAESKDLTIKGYASVFNTPDISQETWCPNVNRWVIASDIVEKGAFRKTISERKDKIKICLNHNLHNLVGKLIEANEDDYGLFCEIKISNAEEELKTKIREGIYTDFSFGFKVVKSEFEAKEDETYIRRVKEIKLFEISIVTFPRHEGATITDLKSFDSANLILDSLISIETKEERKYQLMQLKSLIKNKPVDPLEKKEPIADSLDITKLKFLK